MIRRVIFVSMFIVLMFPQSGCNQPEQQEQEVVISEPAYYDPLFQRDGNCDFRGIRWGMSPEEVKAIEDMEVYKEGIHPEFDNYMLRYDSVPFNEFSDVTLRYFFLDEKCFLGVYYFYEIDYAGYEALLRKLSDVYGDTSYANEKNDHTLGWQTQYTHIFLRYYYSKNQLVVTLNYVSKEYSPEHWKNW